MKALDALGNPVRRQMLAMLRERPHQVGELAAAFPISRPAISRHLKLRTNLYTVRREGFEAVEAWLEAFWDDALTRYKLVAENLESE